MTIINSPQEMNVVYDKYKDLFEPSLPSFHNLLWQIVVNRQSEHKTIAFTTNYDGNGLTVGIAHQNENGYQPTHVYFKREVKHDQASDILEDINAKLFGLTDEAQFLIVASSMRH